MSEETSPRELASLRIKPLGDWCVVLPFVEESMTSGGIHMVRSEDAMPARAYIVSTGPMVTAILPEGTEVLIKKYQGILYDLDGEEVMLLPESAIVGVVRG